MNIKKNLTEMLKKDGKARLLLGGMILDGTLLIALIVAVGLVAIF